MAAEGELDWKGVVSSFRVMPARDLLQMNRMERHQSIRDDVRWLTKNEPPLALLFISHRWETLEHPDPTGRQLRAIQNFLRRVCIVVEAMAVPRQDRLRLVPSLGDEGVLQAQEVARRMLGFGPFSGVGASVGGRRARETVAQRLESFRGDAPRFRDWMAGRIGVWLDYTCMPQKPLAPEEVPEFRRSLAELDALVASSAVVALRQANDGYPLRGWCASEFFLGSARSFARGIFIDVDRLERAQTVLVPDAPAGNGIQVDAAASVIQEAYGSDLAAFRRECGDWSSFDGPLIQITPPGPWSAYRALQGSGFQGAAEDPNPFRRVLDAVRAVETQLIDRWLMSDEPCRLDLGKTVGEFLLRSGLRCSENSDLVYLGFLLACHGWIDAFRPLFRACLKRYLDGAGHTEGPPGRDLFPSQFVSLTPIDDEVRSLFTRVEPCSAATWHSRLSIQSGHASRESDLIAQVRHALDANSLGFELNDNIDQIDGTTPASTG